MKNKFIVITSLIMTFIFVFACVGCTASTQNTPSIDEYINNKRIAVEKSIEKRNTDNYAVTTVINTLEIKAIEKAQEAYEKEGETITVTYNQKEQKVVLNSTLTYEVKDGVIKFNQTIKITQTLIERSLNENNEIVEDRVEETSDEFYDFVYVDGETRMYKFDNVNPEKSCYMLRDEAGINSRFYSYTKTAYDVIEKCSSGNTGGLLYKDGAYVGIEVSDPSSNTITNSTANVGYVKCAMDKNGNIKAEEYTLVKSDSTSQEVKSFYEIKYGGSFKSRDITNIPEEEPIIL